MPEIDIGQSGSARRTANTARWTGQVVEGGDEVDQVFQPVPQQNVVFRDVIGFSGKLVSWRGTLAVSNSAMMRTIATELNARLHGGIGTVTPGLVKETRLTNSFGDVISEKAVLEAWAFTDRTRKIGSTGLTLITGIELKFRCLG